MEARRLEELVAPGSSVAIVVDDPSRWTPVREALPIILKRLHKAGVRGEDVTISVGVGRHTTVNADAMQRRVGEEIAAGYRCFSPPVDDLSAYDTLGQTPQGIPVRVFRPVARANLRILVGSVLPHLQAGFGGGYKLVFPGTCHRTTLGGLHREGIGSRSEPTGLLGDRAADNAMRQAIHAAAALLGPCWSVSHLTGGRGEVFRIIAGHPEQVQDHSGGRGNTTAASTRGTSRWKSLWRGIIPGRATQCRASKCCFTIGRHAFGRCAGRAVLDRPGRDRPFVPDHDAQVHCRDRETGRLEHSPAFASGAWHRQGGRIAGSFHDALGMRACG